jgi:hypothetical protein
MTTPPQHQVPQTKPAQKQKQAPSQVSQPATCARVGSARTTRRGVRAFVWVLISFFFFLVKYASLTLPTPLALQLCPTSRSCIQRWHRPNIKDYAEAAMPTSAAQPSLTPPSVPHCRRRRGPEQKGSPGVIPMSTRIDDLLMLTGTSHVHLAENSTLTHLHFVLLARFSQHTGLRFFDQCHDPRHRAAAGIKLIYVLLGASSFIPDPLLPAHVPRIDRRDPTELQLLTATTDMGVQHLPSRHGNTGNTTPCALARMGQGKRLSWFLHAARTACNPGVGT